MRFQEEKYMRSARIFSMLLLVLVFLFTVVTPGVLKAQEEGQATGDITPPRLSLVDGPVSFWRPGNTDWSQAYINTPLAVGDELSTGQTGNLELQIAAESYIRASGNTRMGMVDHQPEYIRFKVNQGHVSLDIRTLDPGMSVVIDTPNAAFTVESSGYYRLDVSAESTSFSVHQEGRAAVVPVQGREYMLTGNQEIQLQGSDYPRVGFSLARELDSWDRWCLSRTDSLLDAASSRYVSRDIYGLKDLDRTGTWENVSEYGPVWFPKEVSSDWSPYSTGSWINDPVYGWTWVDNASWGWAPYHYGRWVSVQGRWAWAPGPQVEQPAYAPALVVFLKDTDETGNVSTTVGWMALGWGEPLIPWWRKTHTPWWGGWGGPRYQEVEYTHHYRNREVRHSMVVVKKSDFGHGRVKRLPVHPGQLVVGPAAIPKGFPTGVKAREEIGKRPVSRPVGRDSERKQQEMMKRNPTAPVENRELTPGRAVPKPRYDNTREEIRQNPKAPVGNREPSSGRFGPQPKVYGIQEKRQKVIVEPRNESQKNIQQKPPVVQKSKSTNGESEKQRRMEKSRPVEGQQQNQAGPSGNSDQPFFPH